MFVCRTRERRGAHGSRKNTMEVSRDGSACKGGRGWRLTARRIGRDARARERVPLGRLDTPMYDSPPAHSLCRASRPILLSKRERSQAMRGSASRNGEARRECAAKRERSKRAEGGLRAGVGGWMLLNQTSPPTHRPLCHPQAHSPALTRAVPHGATITVE